MNPLAILDTSFLLALTNHRDRNHSRVLEVASAFTGTLVLPSSVLPEVCYLIASRLGHLTMRRFLHQVVTRNDLLLSSLTPGDLKRVIEILEQYADCRLDFVDATIVAMAERQKIVQVFTLDRRDFSIVRPRHCAGFEILP